MCKTEPCPWVELLTIYSQTVSEEKNNLRKKVAISEIAQMKFNSRKKQKRIGKPLVSGLRVNKGGVRKEKKSVVWLKQSDNF